MHSLSFEDPSISWRGRGEPPAFFRSLVSRYFELATSRRLTKLNKWNDRPTCPVTRIRNGFGFSNRRTGRHRRAFQRFRRVASGSITLHLAINPPDFSVAFHRSVPKRDGSRGCGNARTLALLVSRQQFSRSKFARCSLYIITSSNVISSRIRFRLSLFSYLFVGNWILKGKHDLDAVY